MIKRRGATLAILFLAVALIFSVSYVLASSTLPLSNGGSVTYYGCNGNYAGAAGYCVSSNSGPASPQDPCGAWGTKTDCLSSPSSWGCYWVTQSSSCSDFNSNATQCISMSGCTQDISPSCSSGTSLAVNGTINISSGTHKHLVIM